MFGSCFEFIEMGEAEIIYHASDAWLLLSVIFAAGADQASLERIIAVGDWINHAIFTEEEMAGGLSRLSRGGYIEEINGLFRPTSIALEKYNEILKKKKGLLKQMELLREFIGARPWGFDEPASRAESKHNYTGLTKERFAEAVKNYQQDASEIIKRLSKKS
jgi:hypothetical protein